MRKLIGFEGSGGVKSKETRVCNSTGNVIVLCLAHELSIYYKRAKYRTMTFFLTITDLCFLAFYTTITSNPIFHQLSHRECSYLWRN